MACSRANFALYPLPLALCMRNAGYQNNREHKVCRLFRSGCSLPCTCEGEGGVSNGDSINILDYASRFLCLRDSPWHQVRTWWRRSSRELRDTAVRRGPSGGCSSECTSVCPPRASSALSCHHPYEQSHSVTSSTTPGLSDFTLHVDKDKTSCPEYTTTQTYIMSVGRR